MESNIRLKHLFRRKRLPQGLALFFLIFYIPLGVVVTVIRLFFAIQLYIILSIIPKTWLIRRLLLRISGSLVGMFVSYQGQELSYNSYKMIIANHITHIDNLAFESIIPCNMKPEKPDDIPLLMSYILKYDNIMEGTLPLLVFPEGATTSGMKGLLKFRLFFRVINARYVYNTGIGNIITITQARKAHWAEPFEKKNEPFLLAMLSITRPYFVQIAPSVIGSYWWSDLLWILFSPYTHFRIRFERPPERREDQSIEEYSIKNQQVMASNLGLIATKFDAKEKEEYRKRLCHEQGVVREAKTPTAVAKKDESKPETSNATKVANIPSKTTKYDSMAKQVQDVLPQVPIEVIKADLKATKCIDTTISNILEGKLKYKAVSEQESGQKRKTPKATSGLAKISAKSFGKSSMERHLSFQERKTAFIEAARQKYIEKHNLEIT